MYNVVKTTYENQMNSIQRLCVCNSIIHSLNFIRIRITQPNLLNVKQKLNLILRATADRYAFIDMTHSDRKLSEMHAAYIEPCIMYTCILGGEELVAYVRCHFPR